MNIAFFGTPEFAIPGLEAIHKSNHKLKIIITNKDKPIGRGYKLSPPPVKKWGLKHNIKVLQPQKLTCDILKELNEVDLGVVIASYFYIPKIFLNTIPNGFINLHPSLLPKYRGPSPIAYSLLNGDEITGLSIIKLTPKMDAGPILLQETVKINFEDTRKDLEKTLSHLGAKLLVEAINLIEKNEANYIPQNESLATYTNKLTKQDGKIDFSKSALELYNQYRALYPWPGIFTIWNDKILKLNKIYPVDIDINKKIGCVFKNNKDILIKCKKGAIKMIKIQLQGKKEVNIQDFINGYKDFLGSILK